MAGLKFVSALVLCMLVVSPIATTAVDCGQVKSRLSVCFNYLQNGGPLPPACCAAVKKIGGMARTTPDNKAACRCYQFAAKNANFKGSRAFSLPGKCGVNLPYKFQTSFNCNSVN